MANGFRREPNWYLADGTYNRLSRAAIITLAHLARCMNGKGWSGCLSTSRLIELTGLGKSSVARAIAELKEAGILDRENGEHRYSIRPDPRPTGGTDCPTGGTTCAPRVGHERPTDGARAPHGWESHPYSSRTLIKNTHQEGAREPIPHRMIPYEGGTIRISEATDLIVSRSKWPKSRVDRRADLLLSLVLSELAEGADGPDAAADPVNTIGKAMGAYVHAQSKGDNPERFTKKMANWLEDQYPDIIAGSGVPHV